MHLKPWSDPALGVCDQDTVRVLEYEYKVPWGARLLRCPHPRRPATLKTSAAPVLSPIPGPAKSYPTEDTPDIAFPWKPSAASPFLGEVPLLDRKLSHCPSPTALSGLLCVSLAPLDFTSLKSRQCQRSQDGGASMAVEISSQNHIYF